MPSDSSTSSRDFSPVISGTTSIVTVPDSRVVIPRIITVPASPNLDQDILEDTVDGPADPIEGITRDTEQTMDPGSSSSTMDWDIPEAFLDVWAGPIDRDTEAIEQLMYGQDNQVQPQFSKFNYRDRNIGDTERPEYTDRRELDCLANTSRAAPYSTENSIQEPDLDCDQEQLEYQYRLMTPREEDISRIDENGIYHPPNMNEIIQDTRSYTILGLETLLFTHSSSHIWSS